MEREARVVYLIYIDESQDMERGVGVFSALAIPVINWHEAIEQVIALRRELKQTDEIYINKEFHASDFVGGRGKLTPDTVIVTKYRRAEIFKEVLRRVAALPGARLFNAEYDRAVEDRAFERLLSRISRTMEAWESYAILICDEGKEAQYTKLRRKMGAYNPVPGIYDTLENGGRTKNITIDRIIEDPFFKDSNRSYFIQLVDFCAFALLRREYPIPARTRYGLHEAFDLLSGILVRAATRADQEGIIRVRR